MSARVAPTGVPAGALPVPEQLEGHHHGDEAQLEHRRDDGLLPCRQGGGAGAQHRLQGRAERVRVGHGRAAFETLAQGADVGVERAGAIGRRLVGDRRGQRVARGLPSSISRVRQLLPRCFGSPSPHSALRERSAAFTRFAGGRDRLGGRRGEGHGASARP